MKTITRKEHMDSIPSDRKEAMAHHHNYYAQFVTPYIISLVTRGIGIQAILNSKDEHLNDIPMLKWDSLHVRTSPNGGIYTSISSDKIKEAGEGNSVSTGNCILKAAARIIKSNNS